MVAHSSPQAPWPELEHSALDVAPRLLGLELVSRSGGPETGGRIVEVEAYLGADDPASHAARGRTPRTAPMFDRGGTIYIYLSYGLHTCINIVTGPAGEASAVLIRALEPTIGVDTMAARRHTLATRQLCSGPGKVGQALGLTLGASGTRLGEVLDLRSSGTPIAPSAIITAPRIGLTRATDQLWRFYLADNPFVSRR